jgi:GT2 family glycosyltransferase
MERGEKMRVSVIIVHYGPQDLLYGPQALLDGCLDSLRAQTFKDFEVIVVDNNIINRGFAAGVNEGIRQASGEYIALLNNDARANKLWLQELVLTADKNYAGMYASKIIKPNGQIESQGCLFYPDGNGMKNMTMPKITSRVYLNGFPSGCAAMYRGEMLEQIGLFDESFFMYNEDTDLGIRAKRAGWECVYTPFAVVTHQGSKNTLKKLYYVERNRIKIMLKHFTFWQIAASPYWTIRRYLKGGR